MSDAQPNVAESTGANPLRAWVEAASESKPSAPATDDPGKVSDTEQATPQEPAVKSGGEQDTTPASDQAVAPPEPDLPKGVKERIDQLTRLRREAEERELSLKAENEALRRQTEAAAQKPALVEPKIEDFSTHEEWVRALIKWDRESAEAERAEKEIAKRELELSSARQRRATEVRDLGKGRYADFDAKCMPLPIDNDMLDDLLTTEDPADVIYHLASNEEDWRKVSSAPRNKRVYMLAKLDVALAGARQQAASAVEPSPVSKAPPPIQPLRGGGDVVKTHPDKLSTEEWMIRRRKGLL